MQKLKRLPRPDPPEKDVEQNLSDLAKQEELNSKAPEIKEPEVKESTNTDSKSLKAENKFKGGAFFIIAILVLFLAAGGYFAWVHFSSNPLTLQTPKLSYNPVTQEPVSLTLDLSSPDDNSLVFSEDLLVQGKASPNAVVFLSVNDADQVLDVNSQGDFSQTIKLQKGVNQIYVGASDSGGNTKGETRVVYYSTDKI